MKLKEIGGIFPTIFDLPEMWKINSTRCGGKFNLLFWWIYVISAPFLAFYGILCLFEKLFEKKENNGKNSRTNV